MCTARLFGVWSCFWTALVSHPLSGFSATRSDPVPASQLEQRAGDLSITFQIQTNGIRLQSLADLGRGKELLASNTPPLFSLTLRQTETKTERRLGADSGWRKVSSQTSTGVLSFIWEEPADESLTGLSVTARAISDTGNHAVRWSLRAQNKSTNWSILRVIFPQVTVRDLGEKAGVVFPRGPGEVQRGVWSRSFKYHGN